MPPEEDARAILRLALRHETSLVASLDPAFAQENWGCLAQQSLLAMTWGAFNSLPVCPFARYSPEDTPLPAPRERLLSQIRQLREELERRIQRGLMVSPAAARPQLRWRGNSGSGRLRPA